MKVTVRTIRETEFEAWNELWQGYEKFLAAEVPDKVTKATFKSMLEKNGSMCGLVAETENGNLVGFVNFVFHPTTFALTDRAYLEDLYTAPESRGKGVARLLIEAVSKIAEKRGSDKLYWHTEENNYAGRTLYDQLGTKTHIVYSRKFRK